MNIAKAIKHWIVGSQYRLQIFFDLLLLILSPFIFITIVGFNTEDLNKDIFIITFIIISYTYVTRWISKWLSKPK
ncbi:MAG: hypothetical protein ACRCZ3_00080 [Providencia rustigianii]|uniref:hypothetical protein n=1 Tax=Providencia rustigianii TaxID=158850 RepID=UPI003F37361F